MRWVSSLSTTVLRAEQALAIGLAAVLALLILLNIATRAAGAALYWVDELAIYAMVWMALLTASARVRMRRGVAVTLVTDLLPARLHRAAGRVADTIVLILAVALLVLCWQWYDPVALVRNGFDFEAFAQDTFKFIYSEPTNTVGIRKFWIWFAVPLMAIDMTLHAAANLIEGPPGAAPDPPEGSGREGTP